MTSKIYESSDPYKKLTNIFKELLDKHAPIKTKTVRGNHAPFMNKKLSKAIMNKARERNRYLKHKSRENFLAYKKAKNFCNLTNKKAKNDCFYKVTGKGFMSNKLFWDTVNHS